MTDERIKLLLDMGVSAETAKKVAAELQAVGTSAKGAAGDLQQLETSSINVGMAGTRVATATDEASKSTRNLGRTALESGRFMQDFAQGGIGGVLNNVEGLALALGGGPGLAGVMTALGLAAFFATPKLKEMWGALMGGDGGAGAVRTAIDAAIERLDSMKDRAEDIAKSFERMAGAATKAQVKGAKGLEQVITEAPTEAITSGLTGALAGTEFGAKLNEATRKRIAALEAARDAAIQAKDREFAQAELDKLILEAKKVIVTENRKRAAALMGEAVQPGAPGEGARQRIADIAGRFPGQFPEGFAGAVAAASPEAIKRQEAFEKQLEVNKQVQERIKRAVEARNREAIERAEAGVRGGREAESQQAEQVKAGREMMAEPVEQFRDLQRQRKQEASEAARRAAQADRALEQEAMDAAVSEGDIRHERAAGMAGQLMSRGANIVGEAFGPQAAMRAQNLLPAEFQAIKQQTVQRLEKGELPYDAILAAFQEVMQAADRRDQDTGRFIGQLNGMVGRMRSSPWPSGLPR